MQLRALGRSGLSIAPLMFGGNVFGWTADEATSHRLLDSFVAGGFNAIDTADIYSHWSASGVGASESIIGSWLGDRKRRDKVVIATKVGGEMSPDLRGLSRAYIVRAAESSLTRLRTDYIDLYQSHVDDPEAPIDETLEAYA
jgi:aryl-alcohol dehydrogenase-like predicted oxidoreductase